MIISWNVTNKCNLKCEHCYRDAGDSLVNELSTEEGFKLLDQIKKAGFRMIVFSGGEPFMRNDILELTQYAASLKLHPVYGSNGTLLTKKLVEKIKEAGGAAVSISLHMLDKDELDKFTGVSSYELSIQAMKNCKELGLPFQVNTTVFERNYDDILNICNLAIELGARSHHILFMVPVGRAINIEEETLKRFKTEKLIQKLLKKREQLKFDIRPTCAPQFLRIADIMGIDTGRHKRGCIAGTGYCSITPTGDVWPCPYLPLKLGNVREKNFDLIWKENKVFQELRSMDYHGKCGICKYKSSCGGCRARAYYYNGNIMGEDPTCSYEVKQP
ncbi:MAG: radical SAM protein [Promethearchaeota archaeon]